MRQFRFVDLDLRDVSMELRRFCKTYYKKDYKLLRSIPGIGGIVACGILCELAAENLAKEMGLTTVKEVQLEKELDSIKVRLEMKDIHYKVMESDRPKTLDSYIKAMQERNVEVIPTINKANRLQGFRFQYEGHNFKASQVHRSMSGGRIMAQLSKNKGIAKPKEVVKSVHLMGKTVEMSANLATSIAKNIIKKTIKRAIDTGIGF